MADLFGREVTWLIDNRSGRGIIIGTMHYDKDVLCIASDCIIGMPINTMWCTFINSDSDIDHAYELRGRYITACGPLLTLIKEAPRKAKNDQLS